MNAIETEALTRRYFRVTALHNLTLALPHGSITVLLGPNGAGKTTLIKLLLGLLAPTRGHARLLGCDSRRLLPAHKARLGYVSENLQLPGHLTLQQFVDRCRVLYPTWDIALEERLWRELDLPRDRRLRHLSRGMAIKAQMLSVLSYRPELLILDEPFGGLDLLVRDQVVQSLAALASEQGTTILVSSHDVGEVETLVDRLVWIDHGHLRLNESIESIQQRFREVEVELAGSGASFQPPPGALGFEREGRRIRYVDSRYDLAATPPTASTRRLTLREIYVVSARSSASTPPTVAPSATAAP